MNDKELMDHVKDIARKKIRKILIVEGWDERAIQAVDSVLKEKLAKFVLLGNEKEIREKAKKLKVDLEDTEIIDWKTYPKRDKLAKELYELRKHKGMSLEDAKKVLDDENYFGCMLLHDGYVDGLAGSTIRPTADLMRPALQIIKTKPGATLVSEVFSAYDDKIGRVLFFSDCSLNIDPTAEQLAQMAINGADCVKGLGLEPKVAMLSFSTKSEQHPVLEPIRKAVKIVKEKRPDILIDGEIQADAAISKDACKRKCPDSPLKGEANVLIFPNLTAANIATHLLLRLSNLKFLFTTLMGIRKPVKIVGRSVSVELVEYALISCAAKANME